ncbi:hydroxyacid dehydrogenase [Virgibacillus necropolis]|uniref:hydroxyacid dehydrogenase n=1 Tax=Virgibacillus necropolis TaxID=163877 RepID=UPI00384C82FF
MIKGLFIMDENFIDLVYPSTVKKEIEKLANIYSVPLSSKDIIEDKSILQEAEVIFTGWGGPKLDKEFLEAAPNLKAIFYAAGSIKPIATEAFWDRNIVLTNAVSANAIPVAEYTLSQILFSLKRGWQFALDVKKHRKYPEKPFYHIPGSFGSTVGLISLSTVGRKVNEYLRHFDINVLAYDPFVDKKEAAKLNVELCSLDDIFERADIVSLHAPLLDETTRLIRKKHFELMKPYASFINTSRGAIVKETEMLDVLKQRGDITAILDVTDPEPPSVDSLLYSLPNVVLTPHIAGSEGQECGRMGAYMLDEFKRYLSGEQLIWQVSKKEFDVMA